MGNLVTEYFTVKFSFIIKTNFMPKPLPGNFIPKEEASRLIANFQQGGKMRLLSIFNEKAETKSIHYTREFIENILEEMNTAQATGLRLYFGNFAETDSNPKDPNKQDRRLMAIFVMTQDIDGIETDIFLEDAPDFAARLENTPTIGTTFDHGKPCPPDCGGSLLPLP
jgi:hypothetical protein